MAKDTSSAGGIMSAQFEEDSEEYIPTPTKIAQRILDVLALNMPAKYLDETILNATGECMHSPDPAAREAGAITLGVIAEGTYLLLL